MSPESLWSRTASAPAVNPLLSADHSFQEGVRASGLTPPLLRTHRAARTVGNRDPAFLRHQRPSPGFPGPTSLRVTLSGGAPTKRHRARLSSAAGDLLRGCPW